ncbi:MAG: histidine kinase [Chloroflexi bacterium]|nr:histidine kinase [Chloroflexota bacterium]
MATEMEGGGLIPKRITPLNLIFFAIWGALTGLTWLLTAPIPLAPGALHWRIFAFMPQVIGIFFGPWTGFASGYLGTLVWAILGGYFNVMSPVTDGIGCGLQGLIPGLMINALLEPNVGVGKIVLWSTISGVIMVPIVAVGMYLVGIVPFWTAIYILIISDLPPIIIATPIVVRALAPALTRLSWLPPRV